MCLCHRLQQSQNMTKISKPYILTLPNLQGNIMSVNCEQPIDELTVQVWLLHHHQNYKNCTLFVSVMELWTDKQMDDLITRCPGDLSGWENKITSCTCCTFSCVLESTSMEIKVFTDKVHLKTLSICSPEAWGYKTHNSFHNTFEILYLQHHRCWGENQE